MASRKTRIIKSNPFVYCLKSGHFFQVHLSRSHKKWQIQFGSSQRSIQRLDIGFICLSDQSTGLTQPINVITLTFTKVK